VSAYVCFILFGSSALRRLAGHGRDQCTPPRVQGSLGKQVTPNRTRREYLRGRYDASSRIATPFEKQGSGQHSSLLSVQALIEIPAGEEPLERGAIVNVLPVPLTR
jgi:molybdopterin biosynthesis enzyme